jgi:hypothetical protein
MWGDWRVSVATAHGNKCPGSDSFLPTSLRQRLR